MNNKIKKIFAIILILSILNIVFTGCGQIKEESNSNKESKIEEKEIKNVTRDDKWNILIDYFNKNNNILNYENSNYEVTVKLINNNELNVDYSRKFNSGENPSMEMSILTSIPKDGNIINLKCKGTSKIMTATMNEEFDIQLDMATYKKNSNVEMNNYKIYGNQVDGSPIASDAQGLISSPTFISENINNMLYGIDQVLYKIRLDEINKNGKDNAIEIRLEDIGFIVFEN